MLNQDVYRGCEENDMEVYQFTISIAIHDTRLC